MLIEMLEILVSKAAERLLKNKQLTEEQEQKQNSDSIKFTLKAKQLFLNFLILFLGDFEEFYKPEFKYQTLDGMSSTVASTV